MTPDTAAQPTTHAFQAEVSRLLHLMVHSVYSDKDIFLRELISNAADACEKLRFLALSEPALLGDARLAVTIAADKDAGTITISDNGIGMTAAELADNLGTIARSGTKAFLDGIADKDEGSRLIGQFGVGFYSAFMVADRVAVVSRRAGDDAAAVWESDGLGTFTIAPVDLAEAPAHGTRITLHLNAEARDYAEETTIERIVRTWSAHVPVPVEFVKPDAEAPVSLADGSAIWTKPKSELTPDDYKDFYGTVSGQWDDPALTIHYRAEGRHEYSVLLFVPSMKPFDLFDPDRKGKVKLYVRRVFITDDAPLLPAWLRFVRGVIDSEDLPLNLSREMLQSNPVIDAIRKAVTGRVLSELAKLADADKAAFAKVWDAFGAVIKEGLYEDYERRDDIFKLARFRTTASGEGDGGEGLRSLADYVRDLKENQTKIYYVAADSAARAAASPHLEGFRARGVEVLLLTDPVDAFWVRTALGYEGKPFQSVTQGAADLDAIALKEAAPADEPAADARLADWLGFMKERLAARVADVRVSKRLAESAVCLVAPDHGPDRQFEKIMARHQGGGEGSKPILEVNPRHALVTGLAGRDRVADAALLADAAEVLFGQARILDGETPDDPTAFAAALDRLLAGRLG
jgi:molecular chaperone HtpG